MAAREQELNGSDEHNGRVERAWAAMSLQLGGCPRTLISPFLNPCVYLFRPPTAVAYVRQLVHSGFCPPEDISEYLSGVENTWLEEFLSLCGHLRVTRPDAMRQAHCDAAGLQKQGEGQ